MSTSVGVDNSANISVKQDMLHNGLRKFISEQSRIVGFEY